MIELRNVSVQLSSGRHGKTVLNNVNMTLPTDRKLAILGHAGSGKSTLINVLAGVAPVTSGTIKRFAKVSFPVGFSGGFNPKLTLRQNLAHVATLYGADADELIEFVANVTRTELLLNSKFGEIPRDMRGRFVYATGFAIPFDVYLFDSIIAMGDPEFRQKCEWMLETRMKTAGYIFATRNPLAARRYGAELGAVIDDGKITIYDSLDEATERFNLIEPAIPSSGQGGEYSTFEDEEAP